MKTRQFDCMVVGVPLILNCTYFNDEIFIDLGIKCHWEWKTLTGDSFIFEGAKKRLE